MSRLDIETALRDGIRRTLEDDGLAIAAALFVLGSLDGILAGAAATWGGARTGIPQAVATTPYQIPFGLPPALAGTVTFLAWIATGMVVIGAIRLFVDDPPVVVTSELFTRGMIRAWVNLVVGGIVFGIAVAVGFILLFIPGIFLLVSLAFWPVFVATEDVNFVDGFRSSWALVHGHRWNLLALGFVVVGIILVVGAAFGGFGLLVGGVTGLLIAQVGSALTTTFSTATLARAYTQLVAARPEAVEASDAGNG